MLDTFLRESPLYQEILEEGEMKGLERGRDQGHVEEARQIILLIVQQRFPTIQSQVAEYLATITDLDQLRVIIAKLVLIQGQRPHAF